jgi:asparagine synthase (glutamine-hydrolysing)
MFDVLSYEFAPPPLPDTPTGYGGAVSANVHAPAQLQAIEVAFKWGASAGLDVRLPFLDYQLVRFLMSLPDDVAYHEHRLKPLLRDALGGIVPQAVIERRDKGDYTTAIQRAQLPRQPVLDLLEELQRPVEFGLMSARSAVETLARLRRATNIADTHDELMVLLSVDTWLRLFFQNEI